MTKEIQAQIDECTMYLEGFQTGEQEWSAEEIISKYFREYKVRNIRVPKGKDGHSKGFAIIEFDSIKTVQQLQELAR